MGCTVLGRHELAKHFEVILIKRHRDSMEKDPKTSNRALCGSMKADWEHLMPPSFAKGWKYTALYTGKVIHDMWEGPGLR